MNEGINLKHTNEEQSEMVEHFSKEIPEQTNIGCEVRYG